MTFILLDTLLLVAGSTLYRFRCPERIQEFSEHQWVEEHGHPRLIYIGDQSCTSGKAGGLKPREPLKAVVNLGAT